MHLLLNSDMNMMQPSLELCVCVCCVFHRRMVACRPELGHDYCCDPEFREHHELPHRVAQDGARSAQALPEVVPVRDLFTDDFQITFNCRCCCISLALDIISCFSTVGPNFP